MVSRERKEACIILKSDWLLWNMIDCYWATYILLWDLVTTSYELYAGNLTTHAGITGVTVRPFNHLSSVKIPEEPKISIQPHGTRRLIFVWPRSRLPVPSQNTLSTLSFCNPNFPPNPLAASVCDPCLLSSVWSSYPCDVWEIFC